MRKGPLAEAISSAFQDLYRCVLGNQCRDGSKTPVFDRVVRKPQVDQYAVELKCLAERLATEVADVVLVQV